MRDSLSSLMQKITTSRIFEMSIMVVILINCIFIGLETYGGSPVFDLINKICLYIYTVEISMRFMARISLKKFFTNAYHLKCRRYCCHSSLASIPNFKAFQDQYGTSPYHFRDGSLYESFNLQCHGNAYFHVCVCYCRYLFLQTSNS